MPGPANALNISQEGLTYFDGVNTFTGVPGVTLGYVLTDNGPGNPPSFQAASGGSGIVTIDGDSGSISGSTVTIKTGNSTQNSGSSVLFVNSGTISTLNVTDSSNNTILGNLAGNATLSGTINCVYGHQAGHALTTGFENNFYGHQSGLKVTTGYANNLFGTFSGSSLISGADNVLIGQNSGSSIDVGGENILIGPGAAINLVSGNYNLGLGSIVGNAYTTSESSNILLQNVGVIGDSNVMRLGTDGSGNKQVNTCYIAGINGNTVSNTNMVTIDTTTGQLGTAAVPGGGGITTINGDTGSITGSTVTIKADTAGRTSGATVSFINSGTTSVLNVTDANINTIIGEAAGSASISGAFNCGFGFSSLTGLSSGSTNSGFGGESLTLLTTGNNNTAFGAHSLESLKTGNNNTACGQGTNVGDTGSNNTLIGNNARVGATVTTDSNNTLLGASIGFYSGNNSTVIGYGAGVAGSDCSNMIAIGAGAGNSAGPGGNDCIFIGNTASSSDVNTIRIGTQGSGSGQQNLCFVAGIHGATVTGAAVLVSTSGQLGDIVSSIKVKENIENISKTKQSILDCRPVSFNYKSDPEKIKCFGMIAEEVAQVFPDLVLYKEGEPYTIKYHEMPALLLAEIQKLNVRIAQLENQKTKH
jgi:hypothetical protein